MNLAFVILHYMTAKETCKAVEYIKNNCDTGSYKIVIVDNASPNDSYQLLQGEFQNDEKVVLIKNQENLGFARGNNVGYQYAKMEWNPEFIVMMNNDIFLVEKELYKKLKEEYQNSHFLL